MAKKPLITIKQLKWLSYITCLAMFLATMGGLVVTKTGSGMGCGAQWPLCHGQFIPAYTIASLIEYSHRAVSGFAGLTALFSFIGFMFFNKNKELRVYAAFTLFFVILQAIMGAFAVVFSQSSPVMALHFGFSMIAFASSALLAFSARRLHLRQKIHDIADEPPVSKGFRNLTWFATIFTYIVVYTGAFVTHTDSRGGCSGFPLCNGAIIPELSGGVAVAFLHRVAAVALVIVIAILAHYAYRRHPHNPGIRKMGLLAILLILLQFVSGAINIFTMYVPEVYFFATMSHTLIIQFLFGVLCYMSLRVWQLSRGSYGRLAPNAWGEGTSTADQKTGTVH
ncbi:COX15/CtaA family protein [Paenibacillus dauci]|uniref:COX15/CtaA family protein n=1 Tax=Paenibacillus dauci TaxID=1567106 RepID=UPI00061940A7|nr:heme A synthase [Paenibacillus dauci]